MSNWLVGFMLPQQKKSSRNITNGHSYKLPADETCIVHFTCEENTISEPFWPTKPQLQKGLRVVYIWHDLDFSMIACWWDTNNDTRHVTEVEEFVVRNNRVT
ncbi:2093_t:CDS:2 [Ambispora gerdemannii]|uniref:2093_t:CDS:1 n=1 Tax=Ambispora gerdemannii TaxID=144530 RepID=A0A9N9BPN8_9GLOM|nr:2093_t:CDS:2 [Ambispora gerdemannii]